MLMCVLSGSIDNDEVILSKIIIIRRRRMIKISQFLIRQKIQRDMQYNKSYIYFEGIYYSMDMI
ncbi:unnamed protein product [Paramecium octaurelia]|uniref:Uncharacterized protein n=1 Tax=Paramecium octaurelia TaxID=43137 RepID=A0A8S1XP25_PAROT|nr:unnamed protein product [Paramecium octaurelia]